MATRSPRPFTYEDYLALPNDGRRWQVFDGELVMSPSPSARHQKLVSRINMALEIFLAAHRLGEAYLAPFDVVLSSLRVVQPDVLFVSAEHLERRQRGCVRGAPDLVVEVLSPENRDHDLVRKRSFYEQHGVQEVWFVEQDRPSVAIWRRAPGGRLEQAEFLEETGTIASPLLPDLAIDLAELYRGLPD